MNENKSKGVGFESLDKLVSSIRDGTFSEILDDWKWIFGYSKKYKFAIAFYVMLGVVSTTMGLVSSVAGKYLIDIITGYRMEQLPLLIFIMVSSALFSLAFDSVISRISVKLTLDINNDIRADIFEKILDADWLKLSGYNSGDILNRFNSDVGAVSSTAISWLLACRTFFPCSRCLRTMSREASSRKGALARAMMAMVRS